MLLAIVACQVVAQVVQVAALAVQVEVGARFSRCCALPEALRC